MPHVACWVPCSFKYTCSHICLHMHIPLQEHDLKAGVSAITAYKQVRHRGYLQTQQDTCNFAAKRTLIAPLELPRPQSQSAKSLAQPLLPFSPSALSHSPPQVLFLHGPAHFGGPGPKTHWFAVVLHVPSSHFRPFTPRLQTSE